MSAKKLFPRMLALAAALVMILSLALLCGCQPKLKPISNDEPITLPLEQERTISYWICFDNTYMPGYTTYADHPFFKWMKEKTNINIDFVVPSVSVIEIGTLREEWMGRIAAGDTTDIVSPFWFVPDHTGSTIDSFADEELYYELTEYVNMQMPNFNALRGVYAEIDKLMLTPYQNIMYIPMLTGIEDNKDAPVTQGFVVRKDFLDEIQFKSEDGVSDVPVTVADWERMLTEFQKLGVEVPYWHGTMGLAPGCVGDAFITCYGQAYELYLDKEGNMHYGATEDGTYKYVEMMRRWVEQGFARTSANISRADKLSDNVGCWGGDFNDIANLAKEAANPNYRLVAAPYPVLNVGDTLDIRATYMPIGNQEINSIYVCQSYDSPALACKWIDQLFGQDAYLRASYGEENVDYTVENGEYKFTDKILGDSRGPLYAVSENCYLGNMWAERDVLLNMVYSDEVKEAVKTWSSASSDRNTIRGTSFQFTIEEADTLASLGNIWITQTGMLKDMINGNREMTDWDEFVAQMNDKGLSEYIEIYQEAWDAYLAN